MLQYYLYGKNLAQASHMLSCVKTRDTLINGLARTIQQHNVGRPALLEEVAHVVGTADTSG